MAVRIDLLTFYLKCILKLALLAPNVKFNLKQDICTPGLYLEPRVLFSIAQAGVSGELRVPGITFELFNTAGIITSEHESTIIFNILSSKIAANLKFALVSCILTSPRVDFELKPSAAGVRLI
jgi:hypothetical protein